MTGQRRVSGRVRRCDHLRYMEKSVEGAEIWNASLGLMQLLLSFTLRCRLKANRLWVQVQARDLSRFSGVLNQLENSKLAFGLNGCLSICG